MAKDAETIRRELAQPFAPEDLEWRLQQANKERMQGLALAYVTNRAIQDRLDDVVGPENWHNDYKPWHSAGKKESQICGISIYNEERKEWITKWDGAEDTDIEAIKGGLSDSMKRAAVQWGIGRVLYKMDSVWVDIQARGNSFAIKSSERAKLDKAYLNMLKKLNLTPASPGGLQSELTPRKDSKAFQQQEQAQPAQAQGTEKPKDQQAATAASDQQKQPKTTSNVTQLPMKEPAWEYEVIAATVQSGMNKNPTTMLTLQDQDGKRVKAFVRGSNAQFVSGTQLYEVKLTMKQQNSVVFYVLESFKILKSESQAA